MADSKREVTGYSIKQIKGRAALFLLKSEFIRLYQSLSELIRIYQSKSEMNENALKAPWINFRGASLQFIELTLQNAFSGQIRASDKVQEGQRNP